MKNIMNHCEKNYTLKILNKPDAMSSQQQTNFWKRLTEEKNLHLEEQSLAGWKQRVRVNRNIVKTLLESTGLSQGSPDHSQHNWKLQLLYELGLEGKNLVI